MTSEIAVLNRRGITLAADSAVTIRTGDSAKTYYTRQKIFSLLKNNPIGIMVYNNHEFMGLSWELLINQFIKETEKITFSTLMDCVSHFIKILESFPHINNDSQINYLKGMSAQYFEYVHDAYAGKLPRAGRDEKISDEQKNETLAEVLRTEKEQMENSFVPDGFDYDEFIKNNISIVEKELDRAFADIKITGETKEKMMDLFFLALKEEEMLWITDYSSDLVFAGYGLDEVYPSAIVFSLFGKFEKTVIHSLIITYDVIKEDTSWVVQYYGPVNQDKTETAMAFLRGIAPEYKDMVFAELDNFIDEAIRKTDRVYTGEFKTLKERFIKTIEKSLDYNYRRPIKTILSSLPASELPGIAEALVNMTVLRQGITPDSNIAGGPIDVALITKVDGFRWVKKKETY